MQVRFLPRAPELLCCLQKLNEAGLFAGGGVFGDDATLCGLVDRLICEAERLCLVGPTRADESPRGKHAVMERALPAEVHDILPP